MLGTRGLRMNERGYCLQGPRSDGVICLTGCRFGYFQTFLQDSGSEKKCAEVIVRYGERRGLGSTPGLPILSPSTFLGFNILICEMTNLDPKISEVSPPKFSLLI